MLFHKSFEHLSVAMPLMSMKYTGVAIIQMKEVFIIICIFIGIYIYVNEYKLQTYVTATVINSDKYK